MASPSFLSRPDFDRACRAFIAAQPHPPPEATSWTWNEHPVRAYGPDIAVGMPDLATC
jgi:hypothetical protein